MMTLPERVTICEVGPRDGFQIEPEWIPTETKVEVIDRLSETGLPRIEVTSFVHPKVVPQMRDAEEVMARIRRRPGTQYVALVPNEKGAVRAVDAGVDAIHTVVSASESHNLANVNMTVAESLQKLRAVLEVAARARVPVSCAVSTSFGCPFEGDVPVARLEWVVRSLVDMGARVGGARRHDRHGEPPPGDGDPRALRARASRASSGRSTLTTRARWRSRTSWPRWRAA